MNLKDSFIEFGMDIAVVMLLISFVFLLFALIGNLFLWENSLVFYLFYIFMILSFISATLILIFRIIIQSLKKKKKSEM